VEDDGEERAGQAKGCVEIYSRAALASSSDVIMIANCIVKHHGCCARMEPHVRDV